MTAFRSGVDPVKYRKFARTDWEISEIGRGIASG